MKRFTQKKREKQWANIHTDINRCVKLILPFRKRTIIVTDLIHGQTNILLMWAVSELEHTKLITGNGRCKSLLSIRRTATGGLGYFFFNH